MQPNTCQTPFHTMQFIVIGVNLSIKTMDNEISARPQKAFGVPSPAGSICATAVATFVTSVILSISPAAEKQRNHAYFLVCHRLRLLFFGNSLIDCDGELIGQGHD